MKRPGPSALLSVALAGIVLSSCGSGGGNVPGGGMMGGGLAAVFTAAVPSPTAPNSITMTAGTALDDTFQIDIRVTDISMFFGAAFSVRFDPAFAEFMSFDASSSILDEFAPDIQISAAPDQTDAGIVAVVATLKSPLGGDAIPGFDTASKAPVDLLITLTFRATNPTAGSAFSIDNVRMREVTTCASADTCTTLPDMDVNWNGGSLAAM